jgi:hypothetical protein
LDLPLVMPADGALTSNEAKVVSGPGLKAVSRPGAWTAFSAAAQADPSSSLELSADEPLTSLPLAIRAEPEGPSGGTILERAWISTQIGIGSRQDRAVYRFTTSESHFTLALPRQIVPGEVSVVLNGKSKLVPIDRDRLLSLPLAKDDSGQPQVVEVTYRFNHSEEGQLLTVLEAPRLPEDVWVRRLYWQLSLPAHEHLLQTPAGFVGESAWRFQGLYFGRQPLRSQADLEAWSGAQRLHEDGPIASGNTHLFSSLGPAERLEIRAARRTWLVLGGSLSVLCVGFLLIYLPSLRRALVLVVVAVVISLGLLYPEPLLILLQAGSLGVALVLLAALLERVVAGRRSRALPLRRSASSIVDRPAMYSKSPFVVGAAPSSTRTAAIVGVEAAPESAP